MKRSSRVIFLTILVFKPVTFAQTNADLKAPQDALTASRQQMIIATYTEPHDPNRLQSAAAKVQTAEEALAKSRVDIIAKLPPDQTPAFISETNSFHLP